MRQLLLRVIVCCLPALQSIAQSPLDSLLNSFGATFTSQSSHNGVSIGVYANGKIYYFNYGTVKRGTLMPPTNTTITPQVCPNFYPASICSKRRTKSWRPSPKCLSPLVNKNNQLFGELNRA